MAADGHGGKGNMAGAFSNTYEKLIMLKYNKIL